MRRSILLSTVVATAIAVAIAGCSGDVTPAGPIPSPSANADFRTPPILRPPVIDPKAYRSIVAGQHFTCASRNDNATFCWGLNDRAQIGRPSSTICGNGLTCVARPALIRFNFDTLRLSQIESGAAHTCGINATGKAFCWGDGNNGQRGYGFGSTGWPDEVLAVADPFNTFTSVGAGGNSTCATTAANGMWCWGSGVGLNNTVPTKIFSYSGYLGIAVGELHACGYLRVGNVGKVDCWGNNRSGQFGVDTLLLKQFWEGTLSSQFGNQVASVTTESEFTCVDQFNGSVQCAGLNTTGQLGNGTTTTTGIPQTVGNGMLLHGVTTNVAHACAIDTQGAAWCWGYGANGQLGNGVSGLKGSTFRTPQAVLGGIKFRAIAAGKRHTCGIATTNAIYCWGDNSLGQFGAGLPGGMSSTPILASAP